MAYKSWVNILFTLALYQMVITNIFSIYWTSKMLNRLIWGKSIFWLRVWFWPIHLAKQVFWDSFFYQAEFYIQDRQMTAKNQLDFQEHLELAIKQLWRILIVDDYFHSPGWNLVSQTHSLQVGPGPLFGTFIFYPLKKTFENVTTFHPWLQFKPTLTHRACLIF